MNPNLKAQYLRELKDSDAWEVLEGYLVERERTILMRIKEHTGPDRDEAVGQLKELEAFKVFLDAVETDATVEMDKTQKSADDYLSDTGVTG